MPLTLIEKGYVGRPRLSIAQNDRPNHESALDECGPSRNARNKREILMIDVKQYQLTIQEVCPFLKQRLETRPIQSILYQQMGFHWRLF
jgi:hypothetical protein